MGWIFEKSAHSCMRPGFSDEHGPGSIWECPDPDCKKMWVVAKTPIGYRWQAPTFWQTFWASALKDIRAKKDVGNTDS